MQGWCHECIAFPHYTETTVCQPGPLQHLNTDKTESNTKCPVARFHLLCCHFRQQTQNTWSTRSVVLHSCQRTQQTQYTKTCIVWRYNHGMLSAGWLTHTIYTSTPHLYSPQHSMKSAPNLIGLHHTNQSNRTRHSLMYVCVCVCVCVCVSMLVNAKHILHTLRTHLMLYTSHPVPAETGCCWDCISRTAGSWCQNRPGVGTPSSGAVQQQNWTTPSTTLLWWPTRERQCSDTCQ